MCRVLFVTSLLAGLLAGPSAQESFAAAPPSPPTFSENAEVLAVEVPVTVTVDSKPVRGLRVENFEVFSGKQRQPVVGFEVVDLETAPAAGESALPPTSAAARRDILLLFDLGYTQPTALERARAAAHQILRSALHPRDLVAVAAYSPTDGARLVLGFTGDREEAGRAIDTLGGPRLLEQSGDPLRLTLAETYRELNEAEVAGGQNQGGATISRKGINVLEEIYDGVRQSTLNAERSQRDVARMRVEAMTRSYVDLARLLGTVPGRKTVLLLSEGFDSELLLGKAQTQEERASVEAGEIWNIDSDKSFGGSTTQNALTRMLEEFRRAGCVIEAVDVGGLRATGDTQVQQVGTQFVGSDPAQSNAGQDGLFAMASATGGDLFRNTNDLGGAMQAALGKSAVTYVLTLAPPGLAPDGTYHPLTVKLKNAPRGSRVATRSGFYAPRPFGERSAAERGLEAAGLIVAGEEGGRLSAALLAVPLAAPLGGRARVPLWLEVDGETLMREQRADRLALEVFFYALDAHGRVSDHVARALALDPAKLGKELEQRGLKIYSELQLPVGSYSLRALVRSGVTGASALRTVAVEVRAAQTSPQLLGPVVPEPANKWINVSANRADATPPSYPFEVGSRPVLPAAQPVLLTGVDVPLCVFAYGVGEGVGTIKVELRDRSGHAHEVAATLVDRAPAGAGLERLLLKLRPADLEDGDYSLRVALGSGSTLVESAAVTVAVLHRDAPQGAAP
ncbi:MAG: VWA domain-containing protein [Acidobacteriota bacterium]